jgi:hypothetical protein
MVEEEDYEDQTPPSPRRSIAGEETNRAGSPSNIPKPIPLPLVRTAVPDAGLALRHPTPVDDQRVRQAAYSGNIEQLERTAERLSMTSSIDDAIRDLHGELKRNDSRRSPLRSSPDVTISTRVDHATLIETASPRHSLTTGGLARSASKSSRFGPRPEPELEGRPLDSYVTTSTAPAAAMAHPAIVTVLEEASLPTMTLPVVDTHTSPKLQVRNPEPKQEDDGPSSPASTDTFDAEKAFAGFDGTHVAPQQRVRILENDTVVALGTARRRASAGAFLTVEGIDSNNEQRGAARDRLSVAGATPRQPRISTAERMSMARSQSYEDPETGQQMVYYPAPVPVMLNLPQKLSKAPSSMARSKRRTQALSTLPPIARQNAIWLPDVLEIEDGPNLPENDEAQQLEYVPQHQRMSMGGRRVAQDIQHLPEQLRASAFFDLAAPEQVVELKEQSAVATLDSILDASAHAPVNAFTDHLLAGHLGAEVYGKAKVQHRGSSANLLEPEEKPAKKRSNPFNLLGRRASSGNVLETEAEKEKRRAMIADIRAGKIIRDDDEEGDAVFDPEEEADVEEEEEREEEYHGAPTTLLAELQLRKQQQKHRTRPLTTAYPNGLHSTLLELDAVAQVEANARKQKRVTLAWEEQREEEDEDARGDDDDVPLAYLYAKKAQALDLSRPPGLIERRDAEDNEPLSRRRDRLKGKAPKTNRASMLSQLPEDEGETLGQRLARLKGDREEVVTDLPKARPVSGDFASEMMSQFGGDLLEDAKEKDKESPTDEEEEETLGQRRKRLQAEAQARAAEVGASGEAQNPGDMPKRQSMAALLQRHPQAGASRMASYNKPATGLLGLHERMGTQRSSTMGNFPSRARAGGFKGGMYNDGQAGTAPRRQSTYNPYDTAALHQFPQPSLGYAGGFSGQLYNPNILFGQPYAKAGYPSQMPIAYLPQMQNTMAGIGMLQMGAPLNQGQIDMVERWRQSVMQ